MAGLDDVGPLRDEVDFAAGADALMAHHLAGVPLDEWEEVIESHGPPANPEEFASNLRNMLEPQLQNMMTQGVFNVAQQIARFRNRELEMQDVSGGNPATQALQDAAYEEARNNPEFLSAELAADGSKFRTEFVGELTEFATELSERYDESIDAIVEAASAPEVVIAPPAPPETETEVAPLAPG